MAVAAAVALAAALVVVLEATFAVAVVASKRQDDGGMEEVMTWRLFMFVIFVTNLQVPVNRAEGSTKTHL